MGRYLQLLGLALGLTGLILQFAITIPSSMESGRSLVGSIVFYLSFFTILTNIAAVLVHVALLTGVHAFGLAFFAEARVRAGVAVAIAVVFLVYLLVLAPLWQPEGLFLLCDLILHYITPALFVIWWVGYGANGATRWQDISSWLAYPIGYLIYALARAPIAGEVPYPFLDVARNGAGGVAVAAISITILFVVLSAAAVVVDRLLGARRRGIT